MANPLFQQTQAQQLSQESMPSLNPAQLMQMMQSFQGTPEQAQEQFCNQVAAMGWTPSQLNSFLDQCESQAKMFGLFK